MRDYVLMTDSCCDLSAGMVEQLQLQVLPLSFLMDGKEYFNYTDNRDISPEAFYNKLREGKLGTTSAVSVGAFAEAMTPIVKSGKDILCLSFSSALSTTYQSACIAAQDVMAENPGCRIEVVDTRRASLGQGMLAALAAEQKAKGASLEQTAAFVEAEKDRIHTWVTVDDLFHLKRGGRVSATSAVLGTMLQMKPIIELPEDGTLQVRGKIRGRHAAIQHLLGKMDEYDAPITHVYISHGDCLAESEAMMAEIQAKYPTVQQTAINFVGPVIGNHTGPGVLALFFWGEKQ